MRLRRSTPALLSVKPTTFSPSQTWGKQTSSFCWCQRYVWHTTVCLRQQHWKDQCVFCYLSPSDRTTRLVVRSCLVMMHRLCAAVCCHSTSISICTGRAKMLQHGTWGKWNCSICSWAIIQYYPLSSFSRIIMALMIWFCDTVIHYTVVRIDAQQQIHSYLILTIWTFYKTIRFWHATSDLTLWLVTSFSFPVTDFICSYKAERCRRSNVMLWDVVDLHVYMLKQGPVANHI